MDAFFVMLKNVIVFVALGIPGYILVKCGQIKVEQSGILSKMLMYVAMPFLVLTSAAEKIVFNAEQLVYMLVVAVVCIAYTFFMYFATLPLTQMEKERKKQSMMRFSAMFANNGFLGIPLAIAVFGADSLVPTVVIIMNIINNMVMQTLGAYLVSGDRKQIRMKNVLLNPVLIAFLVGVVLNLLDVKSHIPEVSSYATYFSGIVSPLSMTIVGMKMASVKMRTLFSSWRTYYISALKLIVSPVVIVAILLIARAFGTGSVIDAPFVLGTFVAFAMPTAGLASALADSFDGDSQGAAVYILGTTILSIVTIPVLYFILCLII